ncbi:MAG TPA: discoidin domain-containing protein [Streptosporangiaceae bacterium]|nr:discoidin domain-containing protein [Streptosporangiaceae bacterium]
MTAVVTALALIGLALALTFNAHASPAPTAYPAWGTLDTQTNSAVTEGKANVMAMFEFNWASFEPTQGVLSSSYLATMKSELASYQAAGQKVTLGLGLQNPPSWVFNLANSKYIDQNGNTSTEANFVFSQAVRTAAASYLSLVAAAMPMSNFWAIRLTSGGDGEMLYPGGGAYWAFDQAALTGTGLASGMTRNPDPSWKPGTSGLTQAQISTWVNWYIGGLDNVTNWQMTTLSGLGFTGYYETVTPGSGTRPDGLTQTEQQNLSNDGTTGVGAVWNLYYAQLSNKTNVIAYISSVADQSGGNDSCQASDASLALTSTTMDAWSATRWISRIAVANNLPVGGENPGYGLPASLDSFYTNTSSTGMMASAIRMAVSCNFKVFYWAHDIHLWDGTLTFASYASSIAPYGAAPAATNLATAGTVTASTALSGFPATNANDANQNSYWQATGASATLTLHLAQASTVARVVLELPSNWGTRNQTIQIDGSSNGTTWTTLVASAVYPFTSGSNVVTIPVPSGTQTYLRLDLSANNAQGVPQLAEFQAFSS